MDRDWLVTLELAGAERGAPRGDSDLSRRALVRTVFVRVASYLFFLR